MLHRLRSMLATALALLLPLSLAAADEIALQGGSTLQGTVLERGSVDGAKPTPWRVLTNGGDLITLRVADVKSATIDKDAPKAGQYMRFVAPATETGGAAGGLELAIAHFVHPNGGPRVDLVSAVHIADAGFFQVLQRWLDGCDAVLYEGVKPKDATAEDFQRKTDAPNPIRALQTKMASWFGLKFQLDAIDYTRENFIHADLTAEEFAKAAGPRDDSGNADGTKADGTEPESPRPALPGLPGNMKQLMAMVDQLAPMLEGLMAQSPEMRNGLKRVFAQVMGRPEVMGKLLQQGTAFTDLVLNQRNEVVVKRLQARIREQPLGSIAILYGAAHMADLENALVQRLGYRRAGARWIKAWSIEAGPPPVGLGMMLPALGLPEGPKKGEGGR